MRPGKRPGPPYCTNVGHQPQALFPNIDQCWRFQSAAMWRHVWGAWRSRLLDHSVLEDGGSNHLRNVTTNRHDVIRRLAGCTSTAVRASDGAFIKICFHLLPAPHVIVIQNVFSSKFCMNSLFPRSTHGSEVEQKAFGHGQSNPSGSVLPFQAGVMSVLSEPHQTSWQPEPQVPFLCGPATLRSPH